jgi:hypothetical protein
MAQQDYKRGEAQFEKRNRSPWFMMALIFGGLILLGVLWTRSSRPLQSVPGDTEVSVQPTADQVTFENIQVAVPPTGAAGNVVIQADLRNSADAPLAAVIVEGIFMDENGEAIYRQQQPVMAVKKEGTAADEAPMAEQTIPRRGVGAVRIEFSGVPTNWNKKDPQLKVVDARMQPLAKPAEEQQKQ